MFRTFIRTVASTILAVLFTAPLLAHGVVRFDNGRWYDGTSFSPGSMYSVEGALRSEWAGTVDEVIDLEGLYIVPPLADAHTHAFADGSDGSKQAASFLRDGIFFAKNPNNLPALRARAAETVNRPGSVSVIYSNGGLTSTGGHPVQIYRQIATQTDGLSEKDMVDQAYYEIDTAADLDRKWKRILEDRPDFIKVYLEFSEEYDLRKGRDDFFGRRGLDPELLPIIVDKAHREGLSVSAHVATAEDFRVAVRAGVDEVNHLPLEKISAEDAELAARRGTIVVTTTISHRPTGYVEDLDGVLSHNLAVLDQAGVKLALGTDAQRTVLSEIENIHRLGALTPQKVFEIAIGTSSVIFPDRKIGRLADGYEASFIGLTENPIADPSAFSTIGLRVMNGHVLEIEEDGEKPGIADALAGEIMSKGIDAAIETYHRLRTENGDEYDFSEAQLNALGYALIRHQQIKSAIRIFRLNTEMFPDAANTWDSLGEAYMLDGQTDLAIESYEKSLALNPHNENAAQKLKELRGGHLP